MHLFNDKAVSPLSKARLVEPYKAITEGKNAACDATSSGDFLTHEADFVSVNLTHLPSHKRGEMWVYLQASHPDLADLLKDEGLHALKTYFNARVRVSIPRVDAQKMGLCA